MRLNSAIFHKPSKSGGLLFNTDSLSYFRVNDVSYAILQGVASGYTKSEILANLLERFDTDTTTLERDTTAIYEQFESLDIIAFDEDGT